MLECLNISTSIQFFDYSKNKHTWVLKRMQRKELKKCNLFYFHWGLGLKVGSMVSKK